MSQPERIGRYRILGKLGEGGMGVVYLAEQTEPVQRTVALKILKPGMDTRAVLARFEAERRALALMDHPGIARVLDAGETGEGRPYFVMQRVAGEPMAAYCDRRRLGIEERVALLATVCHAVHHAHEKGVVHRDLKPSNILVSEVDGQPRAKIIDFGIAKSLSQPLTGQTLFTRHGSLIGTPEYMSPEQALATPEGVGATADVYSLGALLYELLAGTPPFDPADLRGKGLAEVQRILREVDPVPPSRRLAALGDRAPRVARDRGLEPAALARRLRGELDWITMKALEKYRLRRYASAHDMALDLERFAAGEPVAAARPGLGYRLGKVLRRRRGALGVAGLAAVAASLLAVVVWQGLRPAPPVPVTPARLVPLTTGQANDGEPCLSPDGRQVVFVSDRDGGRDLWLMDLDGGEAAPLTRTPEIESFPAWSPDGGRIAFARRRLRQSTWDLWVREIATGAERRVVGQGSEPCWSPDGRWLGFSDVSAGWARLARIPADGSGPALAITPVEVGLFHRYPAWSPEGGTLVYKRSPGGMPGQLMQVPVEGGRPQVLVDDPEGTSNSWPTFTPDGRHVIYSSDRGGSVNLWRVPADGGTPQRVTSGSGDDLAPSVARDGRRLVYAVASPGARVVRIGQDDGEARVLGDYPQSSAWFPALSPDGSRLAFVEKLPGSPWRLRLMPAVGGEPVTLAPDLPSVMCPRFHPEGDALVFFTWPAELRVGQIGLDGEGLRWLTPAGEIAQYPALSPDGSLLAVVDGAGDIRVRPVAGGPDRVLAHGTLPIFSPDGRLVAFAASRAFDGGLSVVGVDGSDRRALTSRGSWPVWMPDGLGLAYADAGQDGSQRAWVVPLDGGEPRLLTPYVWRSSYSPFVVDPQTGDLVTTDQGSGRQTLWLAEF